MGFQNAGRAAPDSPGNGPLDAHSWAACCKLPNSAVTPKIQAVKQARQRLRRQRLVERLHRLGPSPLGHFLREVEEATGADVTARLERYAEIDPEFVRALGGDKFAPTVRVIDGGEP
jgi:hypothetical protein